MKQFSNNVAIKPSKMLAYRNPSNEDSDSIFNYTLKLDAYDTSNNAVVSLYFLVKFSVEIMYSIKGSSYIFCRLKTFAPTKITKIDSTIFDNKKSR